MIHRIKGEVWDLIFWTLVEYVVAGLAWAVGEQIVHRTLSWWVSRSSTRSAEKRPVRRKRPSRRRTPQPPEDETTPSP